MTDVAAAKAGYIEVYTQVGYIALGISVLMLIIAPVITKMMRGAD
jgi:POT family proton-dependent oligopeptide transporter